MLKTASVSIRNKQNDWPPLLLSLARIDSELRSVHFNKNKNEFMKISMSYYHYHYQVQTENTTARAKYLHTKDVVSWRPAKLPRELWIQGSMDLLIERHLSDDR